ncbi:hypothetical protein D9J43_02590 [Escherichia coli]|nr:hypothetical protein [Escherichia coli]
MFVGLIVIWWQHADHFVTWLYRRFSIIDKKFSYLKSKSLNDSTGVAKSRVIFAECPHTIPVMRESQGVHIPPALVTSVYLVFHKGEPLIPSGRDKFPVVPINGEARFVLQAQEICLPKTGTGASVKALGSN